MSSQRHRLSVLIVDDEAPARTLLKYLLEKEPDTTIIGEAASGAEAISSIKSLSPDLVLLDIQMPKMDGFEVIRQLGTACPHVIFVTAFHEYAIKAFEVYALDYLLKPPVPARFSAAMERARHVINTERRGSQRPRLGRLLRDVERMSVGCPVVAGSGPAFLNRLTVRDRQSIRVVEVGKIIWIEAADHLAYIHIGETKYLVDKSLVELERELDPEKFVRVRRNAIVNMSTITRVSIGRFGSLELTLHNGLGLSTSRLLSGDVRRRLIMSVPLVS